MKPKTLILSIGILWLHPYVSCGQVSINELFMLKNGISKLETLSALQTQPNVQDIDRFSDNQINYSRSANLFMANNKNLTLLIFNQDKLWQQNLRIWYNYGQYQMCISKYNEIIKSFSSKLYNKEPYDQTNPDTKEKIGEGVQISKKSNPNWIINIFYIAEFEKRTGKIEDYELDAILVDKTLQPSN